MTQVTLNNGSIDSAGSLVLKTNGTTTAVTIDTAQNVGVGVTPSAWDSVFKSVDIVSTGSIFAASTNINFGYNVYYNSGYKYKTTTGAAFFRANGSGFEWDIAPSGTAGNAITFTHAMTLDASGNLLLGTTSAGGRLSVTAGSATQSPIVTSSVSGDTLYQAILVSKFDNNTTTSQNFIQFQVNNGGANCGRIAANGANTAAFASTSDRRVKENITDLPSQLENILALRPVEFDYVESFGGGHQIGFIAQEVQQVFPDSVSGDGTEENILSVTGWSKTEARLVKAIQEQQAMIAKQSELITTLTERITALENK